MFYIMSSPRPQARNSAEICVVTPTKQEIQESKIEMPYANEVNDVPQTKDDDEQSPDEIGTDSDFMKTFAIPLIFLKGTSRFSELV